MTFEISTFLIQQISSIYNDSNQYNEKYILQYMSQDEVKITVNCLSKL